MCTYIATVVQLDEPAVSDNGGFVINSVCTCAVRHLLAPLSGAAEHTSRSSRQAGDLQDLMEEIMYREHIVKPNAIALLSSST